jgi:hypothetical protein
MRSNSLVKTDVTAGSLQDRAAKLGIDVSEALMLAEVVILMDGSGSMDDHDTRDGRSRFDVAEDELAKIQAGYPGKVALVEFSDDVQFLPGGVPQRPGRTTRLDLALEWAKVAGSIPDMKVVVISDGCPDDEQRCLRLARQHYPHGVHTIFVGPDDPRDEGLLFLKELSTVTGGTKFVAPKPGELGAGVIALLTGGD